MKPQTRMNLDLLILALAAGVAAVSFVGRRALVSAVTTAPAAVVAGQPATLIVRVKIADRRLIEESLVVNWLNARGETIRSLGPLHDNGFDGDRIAADGEFGGTFYFRLLDSGTLRLEVQGISRQSGVSRSEVRVPILDQAGLGDVGPADGRLTSNLSWRQIDEIALLPAPNRIQRHLIGGAPGRRKLARAE